MKNVYKEKNLEAIRDHSVALIYHYNIWLDTKLIMVYYPTAKEIEFESTHRIESKYFYELISLFLQLEKDYEVFLHNKNKPTTGHSGK